MNINDIIAQRMLKIEGILRKMGEDALTESEKGTLTVHSMEVIMKTTISAVIQVVLGLGGALLSAAYAQEGENSKCCKCGRKMIVNKRNCEIGISTIFGRMPVPRNTLLCRPCGIGYSPIDSRIQADGKHRMTNGLIDLLAFTGQLIPSFMRGKEAIKKYLGFTGLTVSHELIQEVSEEVGEDIYRKDDLKAKQIYENQHEAIEVLPKREKEEGILYLMMDGSMLNIMTGGWKEIKLGLLFKDKDILKNGPYDNKIMKKRYVSCLGSAEEFKKLILSAAIEHGYGKIKKVVAIGDGAHWIWKLVEEVFPEAECILDYSHLKGNVYNFAEFLYPEEEARRKRWIDKVLDLVYEGKIDKAIEFVEGQMPNKLEDNIVNLPNYLKENKARMKYKEFKAKGYFIGSGSVESGHKVVVQQRMKQSGMRWSQEGAQYIAALRARYQSNMWDDVSRTIAA